MTDLIQPFNGNGKKYANVSVTATQNRRTGDRGISVHFQGEKYKSLGIAWIPVSASVSTEENLNQLSYLIKAFTQKHPEYYIRFPSFVRAVNGITEYFGPRNGHLIAKEFLMSYRVQFLIIATMANPIEELKAAVDLYEAEKPTPDKMRRDIETWQRKGYFVA